MSMNACLLEVCVDRIASLEAAKLGGADRVEVCSALGVGGLTPSYGFMEQACRSSLQTAVMIRPHEGGFEYCDDDLGTMLDDIVMAKQCGADSVVFGALTSAQQVDENACRRLIEIARPMHVVFHRAFDLVDDPKANLDLLIRLGVDRLLTSGCNETAEQGVSLIAELVSQAGSAMQIIAGSGVSAANVSTLLDVGVRQVHASCSQAERVASHPIIDFGGSPRITSADKVASLRQAMVAWQNQA